MKNWFTSKTVIFNVLTTVASVLAALQASDWIMENPQVSGFILAAVGVVNLVLRIFTKEPLK